MAGQCRSAGLGPICVKPVIPGPRAALYTATVSAPQRSQVKLSLDRGSGGPAERSAALRIARSASSAGAQRAGSRGATSSMPPPAAAISSARPRPGSRPRERRRPSPRCSRPRRPRRRWAARTAWRLGPQPRRRMAELAPNRSRGRPHRARRPAPQGLALRAVADDRVAQRRVTRRQGRQGRDHVGVALARDQVGDRDEGRGRARPGL